MSLDRVVNLFAEFVKAEQNKEKVVPVNCFKFTRKASQLIGAATDRAVHHRGREKEYTKKLEEAEKELREKGISMEVFDQGTGTYQNFGSVCSGSISVNAQQFQPKIDQTMLDRVKNAKAKMLEHRGKAESYEKYSRAFACAPDNKVELTVEDAHFFRLEGPCPT